LTALGQADAEYQDLNIWH